MSSEFDMDSVEQIKELMGPKFDQLVETYLRSNREHVENLRKGLEAGDADIIVNAAHPMKSSAGNMGLSALSENAQALETQAKQILEAGGDPSSLEDLIAKIEAQFESGEAFLNSL